MTKKELLIDLLDNMAEYEIVDLHNEVADANRDYEAHIYHMDSFDEMMSGLSPSEIVNATQEDFDINDEWFIDGIYGLESFYDAFDHIDTDEVAQVILDDDDSFGNAEVQDFLDEYADYDDDDEIDEVA